MDTTQKTAHEIALEALKEIAANEDVGALERIAAARELLLFANR